MRSFYLIMFSIFFTLLASAQLLMNHDSIMDVVNSIGLSAFMALMLVAAISDEDSQRGLVGLTRK